MIASNVYVINSTCSSVSAGFHWMRRVAHIKNVKPTCTSAGHEKPAIDRIRLRPGPDEVGIDLSQIGNASRV